MNNEELSAAAREMCAAIENSVGGAAKGLGRVSEPMAAELRNVSITATSDDAVIGEVVAGASGGPLAERGSPMLSVDEFSEQCVAARRLGPPDAVAVWSSANSDLTLFEYPGGLQAVEKYGLTRDERDAEVLVSAVGHAMGAPVPPVIPLAEDSVVMPWLPGQLVGITREDRWGFEAMRAARDNPDAQRLGMLDLVVNNWDRSTNWLLDSATNRIHGFDHAFAFNRPVSPSDNPFAELFATGLREGGGPDPYLWIPDNPLLSRSQLTEAQHNISALRPTFEYYGRLDWHTGVLTRLRSMIASAGAP